MSEYSPTPIRDTERLTRFVFSPIHIGKSGKVKSSVFSHVTEKGCSIQRDSIATNDEMVAFVTSFLAGKEDRSWVGVLSAKTGTIRSLKVGETAHRAICAYDTGNENNPAHGELCQSQYVIEEADRNELRANLFFSFGEGAIIAPKQYRNADIWNCLPAGLQLRA